MTAATPAAAAAAPKGAKPATASTAKPSAASTPATAVTRLAADVYLLHGFAQQADAEILRHIEAVCRRAPMRRMVTPGGFAMSVAMTNCGSVGWTTDRRGYRYVDRDPDTGVAWPPIPDVFMRLSEAAARAGGFEGFRPDACLINRYVPGARMSLHQDKDELDFSQPIVSVSLGLPATFLFGGSRRQDKPLRTALTHGDVVVWGGAARLRFHGVLPIKPGAHELLGEQRINLTFRRAR